MAEVSGLSWSYEKSLYLAIIISQNKESKETKQEVENTSDLDADKDGTQAPGDEDVKNDNSDSAPGASDVDQESGDETGRISLISYFCLLHVYYFRFGEQQCFVGIHLRPQL